MSRSIPTALLATIVAIAMVVVALWCWGNAAHIAGHYLTSRQEMTAKAVCAVGVATFAAAQLLLVLFVTILVSGRGLFDRSLSVVAGFVLLNSLTCAVVLAAVGR